MGCHAEKKVYRVWSGIINMGPIFFGIKEIEIYGQFEGVCP